MNDLQECVEMFGENSHLHEQKIVSRLRSLAKRLLSAPAELQSVVEALFAPATIIADRKLNGHSVEKLYAGSKLSLAERLVQLLDWLSERQFAEQIGLLQDLLNLFTSHSVELCLLLGETRVPQILCNQCRIESNPPQLKTALLKSLSRICFYSEAVVAIDPFVLFDLLLSTDSESLDEIVYACCIHQFHYQSCRRQAVEIAEYKNVTKLLKFIIHSIGKATNPDQSLNWITFMASISLSSSVGIKFFSYSNVEMCLKLLATVFGREQDSNELKISGILCLVFLFEGSNSSAIKNILKSQESAVFDSIMVIFLTGDINDFELFYVVMKLCKVIRKVGFDALVNKIVTHSAFVSALGRWTNGFGLECIWSCRFIEEELAQVPQHITKVIAELCTDFEFLNHFHVSPECSISFGVPIGLYSLAYQLLSNSEFVAMLDQNACVDFIIKVLRSQTVISSHDCGLFALTLFLIQQCPSNIELLQQFFSRICRSAQLAALLNRIFFECNNDFLLQICMKTVLFLAQQNPAWYAEFCTAFKTILRRRSRTEQVLFQVVDERKRYLKLVTEKFNITLKTLGESFDYFSKEFDSRTIQMDELKTKTQEQREHAEAQEKRLEEIRSELCALQISSKNECSRLQDDNKKLEEENSRLKGELETLKTDFEIVRQQGAENEEFYASSIKSQHALLQMYKKKLENSLVEIDEIDQLLGKVERHHCKT